APAVFRDAMPALTGATKASGKSPISFTISTARVDRAGDTIAVKGWKLDAFRRNPVVLLNHRQSDLPIGSGKVWTADDRLKGSVSFHGETGERVRDLVENGVMRSTSVGFVPLRWQWSTAKDREGGIDFLEQELLEFSVVSIPANIDATVDFSS